VLVLKTRAPQVVDLRRHVELEGIEPSTSSMPSMVRIDQQPCQRGLVLQGHFGGYRSLPQFGQLASSASIHSLHASQCTPLRDGMSAVPPIPTPGSSKKSVIVTPFRVSWITSIH